MSRKRNAVILTGYMRNYEDTIDKFRKNLLTDDSVDVFIATWNYRGVKKVNSRVEILTDNTPRRMAFKEPADDSKIDEADIIEKYCPKSIRSFDWDLFKESVTQYAKIVETSDLIHLHHSKKPKSYWTLMIRYCMFFMSYQGWKLMDDYANENDIDYQKVIKARTDFERNGHYPKIDWKKHIPKKCIQIGDWNLQNYPSLDKRIKFVFQDHFAIGNFEDMHVYFDMFNNLYRLSHEFEYETKQWAAEYCLSLWLTMNGIGCEVIK